MMEVEDGGSRCIAPEPVGVDWFEAETALMQRVFGFYVAILCSAHRNNNNKQASATWHTELFGDVPWCHARSVSDGLTGRELRACTAIPSAQKSSNMMTGLVTWCQLINLQVNVE